MEGKEKIRVVWICSVSNSMLRAHLDLGFPCWYKKIKSISGKQLIEASDYAQWNNNAIEEFEKIDEVELHVVFAHRLMRKSVQRFAYNNIHYYAVREDDYGFIGYLRTHLFGNQWLFDRSNRIIAKLVKEINPDIVHMQGAEMLAHSPSLLFLPHDIPNIVQLETLLQTPEAKKHMPDPNRQRDCETKVLKRADYIGTKSTRYPQIIRDSVGSGAIFVNTRLMIGEKGDMTPCKREFDYVYFANYINKSIDLAIEAFGIAHRNNPDLTLDIIGSASEEEMVILKKRLKELDCKDAVSFEGKLPTHEDVITQIRKARFALLPLKVESVSGTIREAMWNGIPVITTRTTGTPILNEKRESVLISEIGDHKAMAENMIRLSKEKVLAETLRRNAAITVDEKYGNNPLCAQEWVEAYKACIDNFVNETPLPAKIINKN